MATERRGSASRILLIAGSLALIVGGGVSAVRLAQAAPPTADAPARTSAQPLPEPAPADATTTGATTTPASTPAGHTSSATHRAGVPVSIDIPIRSTNHPKGLHAVITAHGLNADRTLFVPADPTRVAWASQDAAPGSARGTAILVSHVNYVINGRTVAGAFADLAEYADHAIGKIISVHLADGRTLRYRIRNGVEYSKDELAGHPQLRRVLYDQSQSYGAGTGRLLLVSCGGNFDPYTGEYEDNVFVYAWPVN